MYENPGELPAGNTRAAIRNEAAQRAANDRAVAREEEERITIENELERELNRDFKKARVMAAEQHIIREQTESVKLQLLMFRENKEEFIQVNGAEAYCQEIVRLLNKLPNTSG